MLFRDMLVGCGQTVRSRGRFELFHIKSPGEALPAEVQERSLNEFAAVTDALYRADTSFHWRKQDDYFSGLSHLWLVFLDDDLCGISATRNFFEASERILYIDNLNLRPVARTSVGGLTVGAMLVFEMLKAHFPLFGRQMSVVFRTQNPNVYRLAFSVLPEGLAPRLKGAQPRDVNRSRAVLAAMATRLSPGKDYDPATSVIKGAYSGYIYGRPLTQSIKATSGLARFWANNVDLAGGDAVVIAVCPTHREVRGLVYGYLRLVFVARVSDFLDRFRRERASGNSGSNWTSTPKGKRKVRVKADYR